MLVHSAEGTDLKAKLFRGLADPTRLGILEVLGENPLCVGDIVLATGLSQSNVSNHLACLKDCGLVRSTRRGRNVFYECSDPRVARLLELAREVLADVAQGVFECTRYETVDHSTASHDYVPEEAIGNEALHQAAGGDFVREGAIGNAALHQAAGEDFVREGAIGNEPLHETSGDDSTRHEASGYEDIRHEAEHREVGGDG